MEVEVEDLGSLLEEQRREVAAAEAAEHDLLFAYQLQLEEALSNSLSTYTGPSSSKPYEEEDLSPHNATVPSLFADELDKFEQSLHDHHKAQAQMRAIEDDLSRRIHDQAFAREILNVPQAQWEHTGDYLQRPYGEGSSNAVKLTEDLYFRVYVKGLMGEGSVAGIGVAVCDPTGVLVFEVSKPLAENTKILTDEVAELKALIEGLDVATMLCLKRVNLLLDTRTILQYVKGNERPGEGIIAALVKQATSGLRKFTHCIPSLVAPNTVNFAIKLATDAIALQVKQPLRNTGKRKSITEACTICLQETDNDHMFLINGCLHYYCFSCMLKHVEVKLLQGKLPECPHDGCKSKLTTDKCKKFLTPEIYNLMSECVKEATIPITEKVYCPNPKCSTLMSKAEVQVSAGDFYVGEEQAGARKCKKCQFKFCINCRVPWHRNITCSDYRRVNPYSVVDDAKLKTLATRSHWRQCPKCSHMVSLAEGCYHIYCRCGHEFCYTCGAEWKNKKATCSCPIWDERNIIYDNRRHQRRG